ncbi:mitochondrial import receptor subunit TOM40-1-like protein [Carex littledalei]|uniref:Mitochondrial import receptor subunit TOM40-1-like protein n=1 Tax=Carex littledalei TaxID=544730 RepID=A0A833R5V6_9POAL|nr:mitochondrial import receptor subunit TOM40-1-like protein [Carex littledalei]
MTNEQPTRTSFWCGYKGKDYQSLFHYNNSGLYCGNYIQSVTPNLSLGTEVVWQPEHNMSRINFAARYNTNKMIASGRVWNEGAISLSFVQILSEKVSLASEFKYNPIKRYATLRVGYDYKFREKITERERERAREKERASESEADQRLEFEFMILRRAAMVSI